MHSWRNVIFHLLRVKGLANLGFMMFLTCFYKDIGWHWVKSWRSVEGLRRGLIYSFVSEIHLFLVVQCCLIIDWMEAWVILRLLLRENSRGSLNLINCIWCPIRSLSRSFYIWEIRIVEVNGWLLRRFDTGVPPWVSSGKRLRFTKSYSEWASACNSSDSFTL